jgi:hypothetical protein
MSWPVTGATLTFTCKYKQTARKLSFSKTAAAPAAIQIGTTRTRHKLVRRHLPPYQCKYSKKCLVPERARSKSSHGMYLRCDTVRSGSWVPTFLGIRRFEYSCFASVVRRTGILSPRPLPRAFLQPAYVTYHSYPTYF